MDATFEFIFRDKHCKGEMFIENSESPCLVFVFVCDEEIIKEFGDEIVLRTDFESLLSRKDDNPGLRELQEAVFTSVRGTAAFLEARNG